MSSGYLLPNRDELAGQRLMVLGDLFDPISKKRLIERGLGKGWRCWEIGAGGPSLVTWMAEIVGPSGSVLATDIDLSGLSSELGRVELRQHDVSTDPPPEGPFDLIHARLVFVHLTERDGLIARLTELLAPEGWLVIEDADPELQSRASLEQDASAALADKVRRAFRSLLAGRSVDLAFGRTLPRRLTAAGLNDVGADAWFPVVDDRCQMLERLTVTLLRTQLEDGGLLSGAEIDEHLANIETDRVQLIQPPLIGAWGRRL